MKYVYMYSEAKILLGNLVESGGIWLVLAVKSSFACGKKHDFPPAGTNPLFKILSLLHLTFLRFPLEIRKKRNQEKGPRGKNQPLID